MLLLVVEILMFIYYGFLVVSFYSGLDFFIFLVFFSIFMVIESIIGMSLMLESFRVNGVNYYSI